MGENILEIERAFDMYFDVASYRLIAMLVAT